MKENIEDRKWLLVTRYLSNEADENEKLELDQWLKENDINRKEFQNIQDIWKLSSQKEAALFDDNSAWTKLHKKLNTNPDNKIISRKFVFASIAKMAAAILFLMVLAFAARYIIGGQKMITITAEQKMVAKPVILPDGSEVFINAGSTLKYPKKFNKTSRTVELTGEAFFNVTKNEKLPFEIKTKHAHIKVLGTSFNVLAYPAIDSVQIAVKTGVVELISETGNNKIKLTQGKSGAFYSKTGKISSSINDVNGFAWFTNKIIFNESELIYITRTLERIFNKKIEISDTNIEKCRLTAEFKDKDLSKILEAIKASLNLNIVEKSGTYIVSGKGC